MPSIKPPGGGTSTDALANIKFAVIPLGGAILNFWASGATAADSVGLSIGARDMLVAGSECNIETSADRIALNVDQLLFNEPVEAGQLFLPVVATSEVQFLIALAYLG